MKRIKLSETEVIETSGVFEFSDGQVTISEKEVHEVYRVDEAAGTRLVISTAIDRTRDFITKTRGEFAELNSVMRELTAR